MRYLIAGIVVAATILICTCWLYAQAVVPAGHWEGSVTTPNGELPIAIDIGTNDKGEPIATYSQPTQGLSGLPLSNLSFEDGRVYMELRGGGGGTISAAISGTTMSGTFAVKVGAAQFTLARTGEARFVPPPTSAAVSSAMAGRWRGALNVNGTTLRLVLSITNRPDATAIASIHSIDEGDVDIPVVVAEQGPAITIDVPMTKGRFTGRLSDDGSAIAGEYKLPAITLPLTFRRES